MLNTFENKRTNKSPHTDTHTRKSFMIIVVDNAINMHMELLRPDQVKNIIAWKNNGVTTIKMNRGNRT